MSQVDKIESMDVVNCGDNPPMTAPTVTDEQKARSVEAVCTAWAVGHYGRPQRRQLVLTGMWCSPVGWTKRGMIGIHHGGSLRDVWKPCEGNHWEKLCEILVIILQ